MVTQMRVKDGNKAGLISYLTNEWEVPLKPDEGLHVRFCEGGHSNHKAKNTAGGAGIGAVTLSGVGVVSKVLSI